MAHQRIWLKKTNNQLGISVAAAASRLINEDNPIYISSVPDGEAAYQDGRLEVGDEIFKIDGKSLIGTTYHQTIDMLRQSGDVVELEVAKCNPALRERRNKMHSTSENQCPNKDDNLKSPATQVTLLFSTIFLHLYHWCTRASGLSSGG